jgi:hypothetical protein
MVISRPSVKSAPRIALPKYHGRPGNDGDGQIAIAGAGEIMGSNEGVETGGCGRAYLTKSQRVRRSFRGRGTP